ncbi:MAG: TIGR04002 family protein [Ethanoligenens sp.]
MNTGYQKNRLWIITALFLALTFLVTAYLLHIPVPATGGYIHLGDTLLYLGASMLPTPFAVAAGGIGEALSDALTGSLIYALPTLIIKSCMVLCFTSRRATILCKRNLVAIFAAGGICVGGYYLTEAVLFHNLLSPILEIPGNVVQVAASGAIYVVVGIAFDRAKMKNHLSAVLHR